MERPTVFVVNALFFTACLTSFYSQAAQKEADLELWYEQPAAKWTEALPVGNGRMGAMVFGGIGRERIQFNEETVWDGYCRDRTNPKALEALPEVRRLLFEGKNLEATELSGKTMMGIPERINSYQSLGDLWLDFPSAKFAGYRRRLDLSTGVAGVTYTSGGIHYTREAIASHPDQVILMRITADRPGAVAFALSMTREQDAESESVGDNGVALRGQINRRHEQTGEVVGVKFEGRAVVAPKGGKVTSEGGVVRVEGADEAVIFITGATNYWGKDPSTECDATLDKALAKPWGALLADHVKDHQSLFNRVSLDLGSSKNAKLPTDVRIDRVKRGEADPALASLYFQYGRYLLIACSRPGDLPANLQGVWCEHMSAPWSSDYHTNINLQMNYWPAEVANLGECHLPLFDYMQSLVESGSHTAQVHYGCGGWVVHHLSDIFGFTTPADGVWGIWPVGAAWLCQHPYEHYLFSGDEEFLRRTAYPLMKGSAQFLLDFLVEDPRGRLVTNPSHSPENTFIKPDGATSEFTFGATMDLEIVHDLFTNCIAASRILKADDEFRARLESALARLAPLQISKKTGRLQEWIEDYDEKEPGHRHMSHMYGLHPGRQITRQGTPELFHAARKSLEYRLSHGGGHTGWSRAWIISLYARFEDGERAFENLQALLAKATLQNLFDNHPPFQIDGNFGGTAGIAEMLIQSHDGEIHMLPALPQAWPEGSVTGLRARGGYMCNMKWKNSILVQGGVTAGVGGKCRLRTPNRVSITANGEKTEVTRPEANVVEFAAERGKEYSIKADK